MTSAHIASIYFDGRRETAKKRLQWLKAANLVCARRSNPFDPAILSITPKGLTILRENGVLNDYPPLRLSRLGRRAQVSELTLSHELQVMDVKVAFNSSIKNRTGCSLAEFCTWPLLYQFEAVRPGSEGAEVLVKPDAFIRIHQNETGEALSEHTFFLEVDLSSEVRDTLIDRAGCYLNYHKSGGFAVKNGGERSSYQEYPFRVLIVLQTAERRNNIIERLLQANPPILTLVWLTTLEEVLKDTLGAIWIRPFDYREAAKGTPFHPERQRKQWGYQRRTKRELFVERTVSKRRLLTSGSVD